MKQWCTHRGMASDAIPTRTFFLSLFMLLSAANAFSQSRFAEQDDISLYPVGLYYQPGPGANNTNYNWQYPFGTKLTIIHNSSRNLEFVTFAKDAEGLAFRQFSQTQSAWTPWRRILSEDHLGRVMVGNITAQAKLHVHEETELGASSGDHQLLMQVSGAPGSGHVVRLEVFAKYVDPDTTDWSTPLRNLLTQIAAGTASPGSVVDGENYLTSTSSFEFSGYLNTSGSTGTGPKAYLNWLIFDRDFNFLTGGFVRLSNNAREFGQDVAHEKLSAELVIEKAGYVYAYLSNENETPVEVFFDDFKVEQVESHVIQINGYYPYGLPAYVWVREGEEEVKEKFQGKENSDKTGWHDFHARQYDAVLGRWFVVDPQGQFHSPYTGMGNNPVMTVDPDGEFVFTALALIAAPFTGGASLSLLPYTIGADIGAWSGGTMANGTANPFKWDYSSGKTWGYMAGGAIVGGLSGGAANAVATSGMPFANTAAIMTGSTINSLGTKIYTGGQTDFTIGFGVASYNLDQNEWGYLGKKGNSTLENIGYGLGALANAGDILAGFQPSDVQLNTENSDAIGHSALTKVGETDPYNSLVSVGPDPGGKWIFNPFKFNKGTNDWKNYVDAGSDVSKVTVKGINLKRIANYGARLDKGVKYNLYCSSCVNHTARALTIAGAPSFGIHPFILNAQMYMRSIGARPSLFSYHLYNR